MITLEDCRVELGQTECGRHFVKAVDLWGRVCWGFGYTIGEARERVLVQIST